MMKLLTRILGLGLAILFLLSFASIQAGAMNTINLQNLIDAAKSGDTVTVPPGTYPGAVTITKPLTLEGKGAIIDAGGKDGITVTGSGVTIEGFTVINARNGIYLANADGNTISGCQLSDNGYGVYGDGATNNKITGCTMQNERGNGVALGDGIFFNQGGSNTVSRCDLSENHAFGISLYACSNCVISENIIIGNDRIGVRFGPGSNNNNLENNKIQSNGLNAPTSALAATFPSCGVLIISATGNRLSGNTFENQATEVIGDYSSGSNGPAPSASTIPTAQPSGQPTGLPTAVPTGLPTNNISIGKATQGPTEDSMLSALNTPAVIGGLIAIGVLFVGWVILWFRRED